jgi:chromate transport protein ChrA
MEHEPRQDVGILNLVLYYLRLGAPGFGGPVALCGQMERELVQERKWLSPDEIRDGIAVCQSLPGPLAIQAGIFVSYLHGGFWEHGRADGPSSYPTLLLSRRSAHFTFS